MPFPLASSTRRRFASVVFVVAAALSWSDLRAQSTIQAAVRVTAQVSTSPPSVTFGWPADGTATGYSVVRRVQGAPFWGSSTVIPGGGAATGWTDPTIVPGTRYEYWFTKSGSPSGRGLISAGIGIPAVHQRGKLVLIVDATKVAALGSRLDRLLADLVGDGWQILRHDVLPTQSVTSVKALISADYLADPTNVRMVFLLGRVPVPYSGTIAPDGHPDHQGAWPADLYYGEMNGFWSDTLINTTSASRPENRNIPGDGKFDQSGIPSDLELAVGRVDLSNLPAFGLSEDVLLQNYLDKDHDYRHKVFTAAERAVIDDNFGYFSGEAFAATGWRNFSALLGDANVVAGDYFTTLNTSSGPGWLWSYGCGGGWYQGASGVGSTTDFVTSTNRSVFTILFGSYFGDWDSQDNFLRAPLCSGWTLSCFWAGRPHWSFHQMGLGETLGHCARHSQNDSSAGGAMTRFVHVALMGDPTLRQHVIAPPSNAVAMAAGLTVTVTWTASTDPVDGYHVYRAPAASGPFVLLNPTPTPATSFVDPAATSPTDVYLVRATKFTTSPCGTYWNLSQGVSVTACPAAIAVAQTVGSPCGTTPPTLGATLPRIGQPFTMTISSGAPAATGALYTGTLGPPVTLSPGCEVQLALPSIALFLPVTLDASGSFSFSAFLPPDPALLCLPADFQALLFDPSGFSLTNALHCVVGN